LPLGLRRETPAVLVAEALRLIPVDAVDRVARLSQIIRGAHRIVRGVLRGGERRARLVRLARAQALARSRALQVAEDGDLFFVDAIRRELDRVRGLLGFVLALVGAHEEVAAADVDAFRAVARVDDRDRGRRRRDVARVLVLLASRVLPRKEEEAAETDGAERDGDDCDEPGAPARRRT